MQIPHFGAKEDNFSPNGRDQIPRAEPISGVTNGDQTFGVALDLTFWAARQVRRNPGSGTDADCLGHLAALVRSKVDGFVPQPPAWQL